MKYLIINGSPHQGNTWELVKLARENIKKADPDAAFEEIHLIKEDLPFCLGCSACFRVGHEKCPHFITLGKIMDAIDGADGVIVSSTTYARRETALLKNLMDHLCFLMHRPHFFHSKALVLTTTGGVGGKGAAKSIASFLTAVGFNRCYTFSAPSYSWNDYHPGEKTKAKLAKMTDAFRRDVASLKLHSPTVLQLLTYNLFRGMSRHYVKGTPYATKDGDHWTDDARKICAYDRSTAVPFYKKPVGQLFFLMGKVFGGKFTVTYKK